MRRCGFTLIELLAVLAIIATLLTIAAPRYFGSVDRSREVVLKQNLNQMRDAIGKYHGDKGRYPESIEALVMEKYLRGMPLDPITESAQTWLPISAAELLAGGIQDVRSGAPGRARDGSAYVDW